MDKLLESFGPAVPSNKTDEEKINAVLSHPLFMTSQDLAEEYAEGNQETVSAIQSLVFDGTPEGFSQIFLIEKKWRKTSSIKEMLVLRMERKNMEMRLNSTLKELNASAQMTS
jgi:hypothetical protein